VDAKCINIFLTQNKSVRVGRILVKETLPKRLLEIAKRWASPSARQSLALPSDGPKRGEGPFKSPTVESKPDLFPGNFLNFEFFIEIKVGDLVHLGYPKIPIRDMTTKLVRWGSKMDWSWPDPSKTRIPWVDDDQRGLTHRTLASAEDVLGAEGTIGGKLLRFERILDLGHNQVVYALYCPVENFRMAYGFDRLIFEPTYIKPSSPDRIEN
jgi:hypothetical protein